MTKHDEVMREISRALELLGADRELLATVGSWGDTQSDDETLKELREWNDGYYEHHNRPFCHKHNIEMKLRQNPNTGEIALACPSCDADLSHGDMT